MSTIRDTAELIVVKTTIVEECIAMVTPSELRDYIGKSAPNVIEKMVEEGWKVEADRHGQPKRLTLEIRGRSYSGYKLYR